MSTDTIQNAGSPVSSPNVRFRTSFWIFLGVVLVSRFLIWGLIPDHPQRFLEIDSQSYIDPAEAWITDGRYDTEPGSGVPETLRPPGYPAWLAFIFLLFGKSAEAVVFSQFFLFLGTLVLTFALSEQMFGSRPAWTAVILLALDPSSLSYTFKILSETLTAFLLIALAYCVFGFVRTRGQGWYAVGAGLTLALATLVRPTTYYFFPVLILVFLFYLIQQHRPWKTIFSTLLVTALPFLMLVGGWQWRNLEAAGMFRVTSVQGWALYLGKGAQIYSEKHQIPFDQAQAQLREELLRAYPHWNQMPMERMDDIYLAEGLRIIQEHPGLAIKTHLVHMIYFFLAPGTTSAFFRLFDPDFKMRPFQWFKKGDYFSEIFRQQKGFLLGLLAGIVYLIFLYFCIGYGGVQRGWNGTEGTERAFGVLMILLVIYLAAASSVNYGQDRYRMVVMPLLCLYAGAGFSGFLQVLKSRKKAIKQVV